MVIQANKNYILRNIIGEYLLFPINGSLKNFQGTIKFNEISAFIWNNIQEDVTKENLLQLILNEYDIDENTAKADLNNILEQFLKMNIIVIK